MATGEVAAADYRARGGTGLGLSIAAALVGAHQGTITVDTRPGHGAAFRIWLALVTASSASADDRPARRHQR